MCSPVLQVTVVVRVACCPALYAQSPLYKSHMPFQWISLFTPTSLQFGPF